MDPIATYTERLLQVRRVFTLYPDKVVVDAHWLVKGSFRSTILLDSLKPACHEHHLRNKLFRKAALVATIGVVLVAWTVYPRIPSPLPILTIVAGVIAVAALALTAMTRPRILFVHFDTREGKPGLDIARAGPDKTQFDNFVKLIQKQIRTQ